MKRWGLTGIVCLFLFPQTLLAQKKLKAIDSIAVFDAYVQQAIKDWEAPGLAIVVVKDNEIIFKKSYGLRALGTEDKVNNQTLFCCASTTKAMTATCMGILVDQGKLNWDDPVIKYLPEFQLYDPWVTRELRVRDLFLHNSGVGNADFLWGDNHLTADEILEKMRLVKPSYSMRSGFIYQNIFYLAAGKIIEKISGIPWTDFIRQNIFKPLGMDHSFSQISQVKTDNISQLHFRIDSSIQIISRDTADVVGPAGSVLSCIDDMGVWIKTMLDSSKYAGGRLLKPATWKEMFRPQTLVTPEEFYPTKELTKPNFMTYALGWFQQDYKGKKLNFHTGSLAGAVAINAQMPETNTAVYIFSNLDHVEIRHALMFKAFDFFALGGNTDWSKDFLKLYGDIRETSAKREKEADKKRVLNTHTSLELSEYAGLYEDPLYGKVEISFNNNELSFLINNNSTTGKLAHWNYNSFKAHYSKKWYGVSDILFQLNSEGKVESLSVDGMLFKKKK
ncbi:MAG: serine hydrolase [Chitinophagaceae bacterium]|nr:serine hydrolase [Chitinophagaceae bacterium]